MDEDVLTERIGALSGKVAVIRVGAPTPAELKELQHRVEDALSATRAAMAEGIVAGGGAALLHAEGALDDLQVKDDYATGVDIVRRVLTEPAYLIAANAGYSGEEVVDRISKLGPDEGFDALQGRYGNMIEMGIIDPLRVARSALQNGASVAGLLLTTNTLVAEEQTPWGGSRGADDRVRLAGRGPAPAVTRRQHAAVARARPVGGLGADGRGPALACRRRPAEPAGRAAATALAEHSALRLLRSRGPGARRRGPARARVRGRGGLHRPGQLRHQLHRRGRVRVRAGVGRSWWPT